MAKEINSKKAWSLLSLGTLSAYLGDYFIYGLSSRKWLNLTNALEDITLGPIGLTLSLKTAQRNILHWQIGSDEEEEDEILSQKESGGAAPVWKQACVTTSLMVCGFAMIYIYQNPPPSQNLLNNALTQTASRMGVNMIQLLPQSEKIALIASMTLLGAQTALMPIKNQLPLWSLTTLIVLAIFGARMSDKLIKNYQLGRQFSRT